MKTTDGLAQHAVGNIGGDVFAIAHKSREGRANLNQLVRLAGLDPATSWAARATSIDRDDVDMKRENNPK